MVDVSVIGVGNMGSALIHGFVRAGYADITAYDVDPTAFESIATLDVRTTTDVAVARDSNVVFVAVKPALVGTVLEEFDFGPEQTVISIAAGVTTDFVAARTEASVVRLMPNLAAQWGSMAGAITGDVDDTLLNMLGDLGSVVEVEESHMDTATALNGSGPAFVYFLIQAMVSAAVADGMDTDDARVLAAQTFKGGAETVLATENEIDELIEAVCSPKGTTIEGMAVLRDSDIQHVLADAISAAATRATELSREASHE